MRHASPPDDRVERVAKAAPSNWRTAIGLSSPSSGTEVVYGSPDDYDEEDQRRNAAVSSKVIVGFQPFLTVSSHIWLCVQRWTPS